MTSVWYLFLPSNYQGNAFELETKHKSSLNKAVAICVVNQIIYLKAEFCRSLSPPLPHLKRHAILSTATRHIHFSSRLKLLKKARCCCPCFQPVHILYNGTKKQSSPFNFSLHDPTKSVFIVTQIWNSFNVPLVLIVYEATHCWPRPLQCNMDSFAQKLFQTVFSSETFGLRGFFEINARNYVRW